MVFAQDGCNLLPNGNLADCGLGFRREIFDFLDVSADILCPGLIPLAQTARSKRCLLSKVIPLFEIPARPACVVEADNSTRRHHFQYSSPSVTPYS